VYFKLVLNQNYRNYDITRNPYSYSKNKDIFFLADMGYISMNGYITTIIDGSQREFWEYQL